MTEDSELGSGFLTDVGTAWEGAAEPARAAGVRVVNFRQGIVLSRDGGALERLLTPFKLGVVGRFGSGRQGALAALVCPRASQRRPSRRLYPIAPELPGLGLRYATPSAGRLPARATSL